MRVHAPAATTEAPGLPPAADAVLVAHAQHDSRAFEPLYNRYFDSVFRFCCYRLGNWQDAEDACGDIFANALTSLGRFQPDDRADSFRCWLFTIARNVVANRRRDHARHPGAPLSGAESLPEERDSPEELAIASDAHRLLVGLLGRLRPEQRDLLELRLVGLNDAEIARVLSRSHDAVRKEQSRTINALRELVRANPELGAFHDR
jgi:RNA polymerase sigma-70 factor (ECF subfamily)